MPRTLRFWNRKLFSRGGIAAALLLALCLTVPSVGTTLFYATRARVLRAVDAIQYLLADKPDHPYTFSYEWLELNDGLIAHAAGGIDGHGYTNSREAFESNYKKGFRVFEIDFSLTSDGVLVAAHDWGSFAEMTGRPDATAPTLEEFKASSIEGRFTPLTAEAIVELMRLYPDVYVMTDTEYATIPLPEVLSRLTRLAEGDKTTLDRLIIQIYARPQLFEVMETYPFKSVLFTVYATPVRLTDIFEFCSTWGIGAITMPTSSADDGTVKHALNHDLAILVHPIHQYSEIERFRALGVSGFYVSTSLFDSP